MNFTDLYKKITNIDNGLNESELVECPCEEGPMAHPKQQDSVNMNVSINGQGANGIRDLMDILKNIDKVDGSEKHDILVGEPEQTEPDQDDSDEVVFDIEPTHDDEEPLMTDDYENSPIGASDAAVYGISAVTAMGDDLFSKGKGAKKANGGENPWNVDESLINHLNSLYEQVKQHKKVNESLGYGHPDDQVTDQPAYKKPRRSGGSSDSWGAEDYEKERHYARQDDAAEHKRQQAKKTKWVDEKGTAPNGEKFNAKYFVMADKIEKAREDILSTKDFHRGAKNFVDFEYKPSGENVIGIAYVFDRHA